MKTMKFWKIAFVMLGLGINVGIFFQIKGW